MYLSKFTLQIIIFSILVFNSCTNNPWFRTESGLHYKIFPSLGKDSSARIGNTIKVNYIQRIGDSILESTYETMPYYEMVIPGFANPYNPSAVFIGLKKGDSVVVKQSVDSMLSKKIIKSLPSYIKKTDEWITTIKVLNVFSSDSLLQLDKQNEAEKCKTRQLRLGQSRIQNYLHSNNLNAADINNGIFIQPISPGKGDKPANGKWLSMNCTISTLSGKLLSSNPDSAKNGKDPVSFILGNGFFPPPIEETLLYFRKGDHAKIYIIGALVFGTSPPNNIKLSDDLVFDVHILDVKDNPSTAKLQSLK